MTFQPPKDVSPDIQSPQVKHRGDTSGASLVSVVAIQRPSNLLHTRLGHRDQCASGVIIAMGVAHDEENVRNYFQRRIEFCR